MADLPVVDQIPMSKPIRDRKYLDFLRSEGVCDPCGYPVRTWATDPAHGPVNGMGSKGSDLEAIPLCRLHHQEQHAIGWKAFCAKYSLDRKELVAYWNVAYKQAAGAAQGSTGTVVRNITDLDKPSLPLGRSASL